MNSMTDITELALLVSKAKASVFTLEYISQFEPADIDSDDVDLRFEVDGRDTGTNVSIVDECGQAAKVISELVEALEKAQQSKNAQREYYDGVIADGSKRIAELESSVIAPGIMRCAKCSFVLTKNSINMSAGTITAGDSKSEPCPNGCGPLWPVTWREQALQARDDSEQWFEDLQAAKARITELESRTVKLPALPRLGANTEWYQGFAAGAEGMRSDCAHAITAAGIKVEAE